MWWGTLGDEGRSGSSVYGGMPSGSDTGEGEGERGGSCRPSDGDGVCGGGETGTGL